MALLDAVLVFAVGYVSGAVTRWLAGVVAVLALLFAILGLATPSSVFDVLDPVLEFYRGNEVLFLSGFLFAIARGEREGS
jgi:hypothetical protein